MTDNKFRAVLTVFGKEKILELRFNGLNEERTSIKSIPNVNYRHIVSTDEFMKAFRNLVDALKNYDVQIQGRYMIGKILGLV